MDNLVSETNARLEEIIDNLATIKKEYEKKLKANDKEINAELSKVKKYKKDFFSAKEKVEKMNADIEGFSEDYKNLVERFKDDELANILVAANKEISLKIDERKRKIIKDKAEMNELVEKAEKVKEKLMTLTQEKNALEECFVKISDSEEYYRRSLNEIIDYSNEHKDNLCSYFEDANAIIESAKDEKQEDIEEEPIEFDLTKEFEETNEDTKEESEEKDEEFNDEEFILNNDIDDKEIEEFTLEEIPSDFDEIDTKLDNIFNNDDELVDDEAIYNKDEEN